MEHALNAKAGVDQTPSWGLAMVPFRGFNPGSILPRRPLREEVL